MHPGLKKGLKIVLELVIYVGIFVGVLYGLPKALSTYLHTPYPMAAITSGSMWPALSEGDLVFIRGGITKQDLQEGDVVVWRNEDGKGFVIHRVVKLNEDTFVTKGDANFTEDAPVGYDRVVGKALTYGNGSIVHVPYLGSITTVIGKRIR